MARILVLAAHPQLEHSRVSRAMMVAALDAAGRGGDIAVRDLYALYPDYLVDAAAEQAALREVQLLVWLHPIHWYGMPPLMKLWLDEVFAFGWAYGPGGDRLRGRDLWLATSTGGPEQSYRSDGYNRYYFDAFMPPYEQTAVLAGMRFLPPLVLHGAHRASDAEVAAHAATFAERLLGYPRWPELDLLPDCAPCDVPADARPRSEPATAAAAG
jgi:glutathione-regulated potassium-efflux system ancillary protein KefF